jgi:tRNA threonylcarbamoyl adenosine modification protein (Sua5/YciO/YrdC/YwlC family)
VNPTIIRFNPADPNLKAIRDIAQFARVGRIIAFPTETVYGIGVPVSQKSAVEKLYSIKGRDRDKPFAYHIGSWDQLNYLRVARNAAFRHLSKKFWPGPLTLITLNKEGERIGIRYPKSVPACTLITATGEPFFATSANRSGDPSPRTAGEALQQLGSQIDYVIDAGPCTLGQDSTVVDVSGRPLNVLREGAEFTAIRQAIEDIEAGRVPRKKILLVCTGNSCRTPMAAGLVRRELRRKRLDQEIEVTTCGILARDGGTATAEAIYIMKNREIDITDHQTSSCRRDAVEDADLILAMSKEHYDFLVNLVPQVASRILMLDIPDPIGMGISAYEATVELLEERIKQAWPDIIK